MKFRILENGSHVKVQVRKLLRWCDVKERWGCREYSGWSTKFFESRSSAVDFIVSEYGQSSYLCQPWVVSIGNVPAEFKERVPGSTQQPLPAGADATLQGNVG